MGVLRWCRFSAHRSVAVVTGWMLVSAAWASEPADVEITVWGREVEAARAAVLDQLVDEGWELSRERADGRTVLRHVDGPHHGRVIVDDDQAFLVVRRELIRIEGREVLFDRNSAGAWATCVIWPFLCVRLGGAVVAPQKLASDWRELADQTDALVSTWSDRVADRALATNLEALPDRLEALWVDGVPLEPGGVVVATPEERRAAIGAFWLSRTDTVWGDAVRDACTRFVRAVVQTSETPFTGAEVVALEAASGKAFLTRP